MFKVTLLSFHPSLRLSPTLNPVLSHPVLPSSFFSSFHLNFSLMSSFPLLLLSPPSPFVSVQFFLCKDNLNHLRFSNSVCIVDIYFVHIFCHIVTDVLICRKRSAERGAEEQRQSFSLATKQILIRYDF